MNGEKLTKAELTKIEIERNWKFASLILGLSIGMLAFSVNLEPDLESFTIIFLYLSGWCIFLAFLSSFFRIYHLQKTFTKEYKRVADGEISNEEHFLKNFFLKEEFGKFTYSFMMFCFLFGIVYFLFYAILRIIVQHKIIDRLYKLIV